MRLLAAFAIVLLPAAVFAQTATSNGGPSYQGGSAYGTGSSGYDGPSIDRPAPTPSDETRAPQPGLGGNYGYQDKSKRPTR